MQFMPVADASAELGGQQARGSAGMTSRSRLHGSLPGRNIEVHNCWQGTVETVPAEATQC